MNTLDKQLAGLAAMSPAQLSAEWERLHGGPAPRLSAALLTMGLAYTLQAKAAGKRGTVGTVRPVIRPVLRSPSILPGTQFVRSWNGRTVSVIADEGGFLFEGERYPSLSAIARLVTGAHWSGPRFFGIGAKAGG